MRIFRVTVLPHKQNDPKKFGKQLAGTYEAFGAAGVSDIYYVEHTSPYFNNSAQVGFVSIPPEGSQILVCQTDDASNERQVYYLATLVVPQVGRRLATDRTVENSPPDLMNLAIGGIGLPQSIALVGPGEHSLEIKNDFDNGNVKETGVYLKTSGGKLIRLEDGHQKNNIVIKTADGLFGQLASIELQEVPDSRAGGLTPSYSVNIFATGQISLYSHHSNIDMLVEDGGQINIENKSTGLFGAYPGDPTCGTINIKSPRGDINIIAGPDPLSGYVGPPYPDPTATVNITAAGGPLTSLNIHTDGILNLSGGAGVNIAGGDLRVGVTGIAPVTVEGALINLNTPV